MRKLISPEEQEKRKRRNQLIIGLVLIGLMVFSSVGFAFSNTSETGTESESLDYNGFIFTKKGDYWSVTINGYDFITKHNPREVEDISLFGQPSLQNYVGKPLYFVGENGDHFAEIDRNLRDRFVLRVGNACLNNTDCEENYPIKDCTDNIIVYREARNEKEELYIEDSCVYIISSYQNQSRYADAYLFKVLGIK